MLEQSNNLKERIELPPIPEKRYFTIGEVSKLCAVKPHVLRYWEQEFKQINPSKRRGNRRYYQQKDINLIRQIRSLLYEQGFTIGGARQQLVDIHISRDIIDDPKIDTVAVQSSIKELEQLLTILENDGSF